MHSTKFWIEKKDELIRKIIGNPYITIRDLTSQDKFVIYKFFDGKLNNARELAGVEKRFNKTLNESLKEKRNKEFIEFIKHNPYITSHEIKKSKYNSIFINVYRGNLNNIRKEAGIYEDYTKHLKYVLENKKELLNAKHMEEKSLLMSFIQENPLVKYKEMPKIYRNIICSLYKMNLSKAKNEAIGLFLRKKDYDIVDILLVNCSIGMHKNNVSPEYKKNIEYYLNQLGEREKDIINLRYGIGCKNKTFAEIGKIYGLTRQRINFIEKKAKKKLEVLVKI